MGRGNVVDFILFRAVALLHINQGNDTPNYKLCQGFLFLHELSCFMYILLYFVYFQIMYMYMYVT